MIYLEIIIEISWNSYKKKAFGIFCTSMELVYVHVTYECELEVIMDVGIGMESWIPTIVGQIKCM